MQRAAFSDLEKTFGPENVAKLASAYGGALLELTGGSYERVDRDVRLAIVTSLIAEARRGRFDPDTLKIQALAVARRLTRALRPSAPERLTG